MNKSDTQRFQKDLQTGFKGEVYSDRMSRYLYSTDASLYRIQPLGVAVPRDEEDVEHAVRTAVRHRVPLLPRGAGTSLAGQTVCEGLVLDFSKHMTRILEFNPEEKWVRVQPGIVLDQLNSFLEPHHLFFAPDVATSSRANIGGMIGNNSSGVRSVRYGKTVDHVQEVKAVLASGISVQLGRVEGPPLEKKVRLTNHEGRIYAGILEITEKHRDLIRKKFPSVMRRVSGYNLDLVREGDGLNLSRLIVGSEGTLAIVTEARLRLEPIPAARIVLVLHYSDLFKAIRSVPQILLHDPTAVEVLDEYGLSLAEDNPAVSFLLHRFIRGRPKAVLIVEFSADDEEGLTEKAARLESDPTIAREVGYIHKARTPENQAAVWQVRKNALGVMLGIKGDFKPLPFIEDSCVPVEHLAEYVAEIKKICERFDRRLALYAHASVGVIHLRPLLNLKQKQDVEILQAISEEAFKLVVGYRGSWSGEHGDGLVRSYKLREFFGDTLYEALRQVKFLFDPEHLLNPGKIIDPPPMTENLRIHPGYRTRFPRTFYRFEEEGGFDRAIEMCTGVGQCRKTLSGTMCPSFMVTGDEEHSTRGRANALRAIIAGELGTERFSSDRLYRVLDLCVECKACKSECPSSVDMAKMKAEFLAHYYREKGLPLRKRLIGETYRMAKAASHAPRLVNSILRSPINRLLLEKIAGFDRRRIPPLYSNETWTAWFSKRTGSEPARGSRGPIILFADTFSEFYQPSIGKSAVRILEKMGFEVVPGVAGCCGRPLISAGMLERAKAQGAQVIRRLGDMLPDVPIVVLEPSCYSTFKDDYPDLMDDREQTRKVVDRIISFEELLELDELESVRKNLFAATDTRILLHGHCQQKAILGSELTVRMLSTIPGAEVQEIPAGCCGMAGSFGYEKEHYEISEKMARRHLIPAISEASPDVEIAVSGFSCRSQVRHFIDRHVLHPVEILARHLA